MPRNTSGLRRGGGRPSGVPNHTTTEVRSLSKKLLSSKDYRKNLQARLDSGKIKPAIEAMLWYYAYGKPRETVTVEGDVPVSFTIDLGSARDELSGHE